MKTLLVICCCLCCLAAQAANITISSLTQITSPSTNTWFEVADMSATPRSRKFSLPHLKAAIVTNITDAMVAANAAITRTKIAVGNPRDVIVNGPDGELSSIAGTEGWFVGFSNGVPVFRPVGGSGGTTNYFDYTTISNAFFLSGKGNTLIVTQYVRLPWSTLTLTGTNANAPDLAAASVFKLTLTTNAFIPAPTGLPGTNLAQTIQIAVKQDASAIRTLTWNSAYKFPGNTPPTMTTNASAVDVFSFVSSPFDATVLYAVPAQNF